MANISIYADGDFLESMKSLLLTILDSLDDGLIVTIELPEEDPDLRQAWEDDLKESLKEDLRYLHRLFENIPEGAEEIEADLSDEEAENFVRACSAIRMRIRQTVFRRFDDHELEDKDLTLDQLTREEQYCYTFFEFLALLQEQVVAYLQGDGDDNDEFFELPYPEPEK